MARAPLEDMRIEEMLSQRDFRAESRHGVATRCSDVRSGPFSFCSCLFLEFRFRSGFAHARPRARPHDARHRPCLRGHALATTTRKALLLTPSPPVRARPGHCALRARRRAPPDGPLAAASRRRTRTKVVRSATVSGDAKYPEGICQACRPRAPPQPSGGLRCRILGASGLNAISFVLKSKYFVDQQKIKTFYA